MKIYHIDSSARKAESVSKSLAKLLVEKIKKPQDTVTYRDVSSGLPLYQGLRELDLLFQKMNEQKLIKNYLRYPMN